uniref:hypothetical protein n=1 Tax=Erwinia sp. V71 TaxID=3369424 RepID=UPI003F614984
VPAAFSGLCRVKTGGLALHFELESALSLIYYAMYSSCKWAESFNPITQSTDLPLYKQQPKEGAI